MPARKPELDAEARARDEEIARRYELQRQRDGWPVDGWREEAEERLGLEASTREALGD